MPTNKLTSTDTEDTKELADMAVEQFARFFSEYWVYVQKEKKRLNNSNGFDTK